MKKAVKKCNSSISGNGWQLNEVADYTLKLN